MNNETKEGKKRKSIIIVILALLVTVIAAGIGITIYNTPSNRLSRQLDLGEKYLEEQNYEQAIVEFDKAIAIDPMNERAYIGKAEAYVGMGDYEQAAATYATAVQNIPDRNEVWSAAEQFYLDYAQIYIDNDDYEKALSLLEEGYALLGSEKIYDKMQELQEIITQEKELQLKKEEEAKLEEIRRLVEENDKIRKIASSCSGYISGFIHISDAQIKEWCRQYADILEQYKSYFPEEYYHWRYLVDFYYVLGEYELCLETRRQLYELSGWEMYEPEEHFESTESNGDDYSHSSTSYRDEYGREKSFTGKVASTYDAYNYEGEIEYDKNGKLIQRKTEFIYHNRGSVENYIETYEYDSIGRLSKIVRNGQVTGGDGDWFNESTYIYNESGFTEHFQMQLADGYSSQRDQDYELDEYGNYTAIGQPYNDFDTTPSGEIHYNDHSN